MTRNGPKKPVRLAKDMPPGGKGKVKKTSITVEIVFQKRGTLQHWRRGELKKVKKHSLLPPLPISENESPEKRLLLGQEFR